ncbi:hypothetical protein D3C72_722790 [compost metagenome]
MTATAVIPGTSEELWIRSGGLHPPRPPAAIYPGASMAGVQIRADSRVRETVFGGATQSFLQHDRGPSLLLAH